MKKTLLISSIIIALTSCNESTKSNDAEEESFPTSKLEILTSLEDVGDTATTKEKNK